MEPDAERKGIDMDERLQLELAYYKKRCEKLDELAHIWERCAKNFEDVAEERQKILCEMKAMLGMWISLSVVEALLIFILAIAK